MARIAFFGPVGTFSEQAAHRFAGDQPHELVAADTVPLAFAAVRADDADFAVVPVENSVEGSVSATMDELADGEPLVAAAEVVLPVQFSVLVRPGTAAVDVRTVASHPIALAQVRHWLAEQLPQAELLATTSTAAAAVGVVEGRHHAAVSAPVATRHYPLHELATGVADTAGAATRFLVLRKPGALPEPTGADRTSLVAATADAPGELCAVLTELAVRAINVSRIESRPTRNRLGEYRFYLDLDGHVREQRIGDALLALHRRCHEVRFLGSYPQAQPRPAAVSAATSDATYRAGAQWLAAVRTGTGA